MRSPWFFRGSAAHARAAAVASKLMNSGGRVFRRPTSGRPTGVKWTATPVLCPASETRRIARRTSCLAGRLDRSKRSVLCPGSSAANGSGDEMLGRRQARREREALLHERSPTIMRQVTHANERLMACPFLGLRRTASSRMSRRLDSCSRCGAADDQAARLAERQALDDDPPLRVDRGLALLRLASDRGRRGRSRRASFPARDGTAAGCGPSRRTSLVRHTTTFLAA